MGLYQKSVLKKYIKQLDKTAVDKAYKAYDKYFLHPTIQDNIRSSKEEQYQATFLNELFVNILGYTLNPKPNFNLTTELKNEKGAKKADGAILKKDGKAIAVIELKGTNTKDLESIRQQAFDYKANHSECVYVVTSNFEKLRFYIHNAVEHIEFNLFMLSPDRFALLYLCLQKEHILSGLPEKIKNDSVVAEEDITKTFYADYSVFKRELFRDLVKLNMKNEVFRTELEREDADRGQKNIKLTLFKKSQKLIDRFLFIFFAEDRGLLPPNSITLIINEYNQLKELDRAEPLYDTYKLYFKYLDQGRAGTDKKAEIFAYNGGLFKPDAVLDSMLISDDLLLRHTSKLTKYDFESQVDVNILGHIFENSLNEIESVNAEIEGTDFDKQKTKRKKDGVFYTPKYITKYIVDNTVGKLCEEKKAELKIEDEEYHKGRKNRQKKTLEDLLAKIDTYRDWLLTLTICDPACGSGAFLNQALDFLIREHTYIDELKQALLGGALVLSDVENTILERNIYGVDLNEESVEIAKLSLWLRTAQPRRKLNSLNNNIKCGNSLIDDKKVAGDKAYHWETEFPEVFAAGGFDVVIGNPPYVVKITNLESEYFRNIYETTQGKKYDLFRFFIEKGLKLLNKKAVLGFITPDVFLHLKQASNLRKYILEKFAITQILAAPLTTFDASVESVIFIIEKPINLNNEVLFRDVKTGQLLNKVKQSDLLKNDYNIEFKSKDASKVLTKLQTVDTRLGDVMTWKKGLGVYSRQHLLNKFTKEEVEDIMTTRPWTKEYKADESFGKEILGKDVYRYSYEWNGLKWLSYGPWLAFQRPINYFEGPRLLVREITSSGRYNVNATYIEEQMYNNQSMFNGIFSSDNTSKQLKLVLAIINSKLFSFYIMSISPKGNRKLFPTLLMENLENFKVPMDSISDLKKIKIVAQVEKNESFYKNTVNQKFLTYLQSQFGVQKWSKKLEKWYGLEFGEFIKELNKAITKRRKEIEKEGLPATPPEKLTKLQEMEWMEVFETKKAEAQALQAEIDKTDKAIDAMVYELYGLTEEEIAIVEQS